ncbi:MAG: pre-peptidase C-terminal domain-containing protein, partial [Candidatus Omnitrophica bacterium]|nr:pre-peptidase C-terminal domain-containing protein [Candidatus Omnitrophota bacterium]
MKSCLPLFSWWWMAALFPLISACAQAPPNDTCATAQNISLNSMPVQIYGSTLFAFDNERSLGCPGHPGGHDLVYSFTLGSPASLSIDTSGSAFDTVLSLWGACDSGHLTNEIACNDDFDGVASRLDMYQLPAGTYFILLDGFDTSQSGNFLLTLSIPQTPANDHCENAQPIPLNSTTYGTTLAADNSQQQFCGSKLTDGPDVFFSFVTPQATRVRIDTLGSDLDTVITVRRVTCTGTVLACNDDSGGTKQSQVILEDLLPEFTYLIQVDSDSDEAGTFQLNLYELQPPPVNDQCAQAVQVNSIPSSHFGTTLFAANDDFSPTAGGLGPDVVFRIDLAGPDSLVIDTLGSSVDTVLYMRSGTCNGPEVASNDDTLGSRTSRIIASNLPAGSYFIFVDGRTSADRGDFVLNIERGSPPGNDVCEGAWDISVPGVATGSSLYAADDTNSSMAGCQSDGPEVVFRFAIQEPRNLIFSTLGTQYDSVLYLRSSDCQSNEEIACNDDGAGPFGVASSIQDFELTPLPAGIYHLFLDSIEVQGGDYTLQIVDLSTPTPVPTSTRTPTITLTPTRTFTLTQTSTPSPTFSRT